MNASPARSSGGAARHRIEVMHGVNLDQLGRRDPQLYGTLTLPELQQRIEGHARELDLATSFFATNHEGEFVERLHALRDDG
ncbi:MAG TPA: type II 3-dehydroquinate dehydratase, partial [Solirubrobacteraceae bacterium]|nr:type II 3-dehydroquinate dehydratase [Solirubrobacteraceae bacterium]